MTWLVMLLALMLTGASAQSELVIVKDGGTKEYHRPGCPVVRDGKGVMAMTRAQAASRGYKPHEACETGVPGNTAGSATPPVARPETVYIDDSSYYHRQDCAKLGAHPKAIALTKAGKRWPCSTCRPPVRKPAAEPVVPRWRK